MIYTDMLRRSNFLVGREQRRNAEREATNKSRAHAEYMYMVACFPFFANLTYARVCELLLVLRRPAIDRLFSPCTFPKHIQKIWRTAPTAYMYPGPFFFIRRGGGRAAASEEIKHTHRERLSLALSFPPAKTRCFVFFSMFFRPFLFRCFFSPPRASQEPEAVGTDALDEDPRVDSEPQVAHVVREDSNQGQHLQIGRALCMGSGNGVRGIDVSYTAVLHNVVETSLCRMDGGGRWRSQL